MIITESRRLRIETWSKTDIEDALKLWGDQKVMAPIDVRGGLNRDQVEEKLNQEIERQNLFKVQYWKVVNHTTGDFLGCCGLRPYKIDEKIYEIGFHFCSQYWGHGFASEAAQAVMEYAFKKLKVAKLFAGHNPNNAVSARLLRKLGFRYIGDEFYAPTGLMHPSYEATPDVLVKSRDE